ncbi:MAG: hypothetical protein ACTSVZ_05490 [Promethearchaeota archaeon]
MIQVTLTTQINPSEDEAVIREILTQFGESFTFDIQEISLVGVKKITAKMTGLEATHFIYSQVRRNRTVETFRQYLLNQLDPNSEDITFMVNKQILTQGKIVLSNTMKESPLGPVWITLSSSNVPFLIDYLFPPTEMGKVLELGVIPDE